LDTLRHGLFEHRELGELLPKAELTVLYPKRPAGENVQ
jgi:hypothetical protein